MFENVLEKYTYRGEFTFEPQQDLKEECNAPSDASGIYLVYDITKNIEDLIYIGASGQIVNGQLKHRQSGLGGMKDRLVNGHQPILGKISRKKAWPNAMKSQGIKKIRVKWYITHSDKYYDFPTDIENALQKYYKSIHGILPNWHKQ